MLYYTVAYCNISCCSISGPEVLFAQPTVKNPSDMRAWRRNSCQNLKKSAENALSTKMISASFSDEQVKKST